MKNVWEKALKKHEDFFFFFCYSGLGNHWNCFGVYQNGNFYCEKAKITLGKSWETWLCHPLKRYSFYMYAMALITKTVENLLFLHFIMICFWLGLFVFQRKVNRWSFLFKQSQNQKKKRKKHAFAYFLFSSIDTHFWGCSVITNVYNMTCSIWLKK